MLISCDQKNRFFAEYKPDFSFLKQRNLKTANRSGSFFTFKAKNQLLCLALCISVCVCVGLCAFICVCGRTVPQEK